ncbi:MAG: hypothetical protein WCK64_03040 [Synechococcaceae cyanobacterium ELA445]
MHQTKTAIPWNHLCADAFADVTSINVGIVKDSGHIQSLDIIPANVHDLTSADELLDVDQVFACGDAGYQGIGKRAEMLGQSVELLVAMWLMYDEILRMRLMVNCWICSRLPDFQCAPRLSLLPE